MGSRSGFSSPIAGQGAVPVRAAEPPARKPLQQDLVTVVVPARNEERHIADCVRSILRQDHAALQVLVVDGASEDRTRDVVTALAAEDRRVELLSNPARTIPRALNIALGAARGRWLVRVDAHATIPPDYVSRAVSHLRGGRLGGVGGRKDGVARTPSGRAVAAVMASRFGVGNSLYHYGTEPQLVDHVPFGAYPTDLARRLGGWDERLLVNQDFEFDHRLRRAGHRLLFDPALRIDWECRQSVRALLRQYVRYGRGKAKVVQLHPGSLRLRHLAPPAVTAGLAAGAATAAFTPWVLAAVVVPYLAVLVLASVTTGARLRGWRARFAVPAAFLAMHLGWGFGFWWGLVRDRPGTPPPTLTQRPMAASAAGRTGR